MISREWKIQILCQYNRKFLIYIYIFFYFNLY